MFENPMYLYYISLYLFQKGSKSAVAGIFGSSVDPTKGRHLTINANRLLSHERTWGPKNGLAVPTNVDHVMYWVG